MKITMKLLACKVCGAQFCRWAELPWHRRSYCTKTHMLERESIPEIEERAADAFLGYLPGKVPTR